MIWRDAPPHDGQAILTLASDPAMKEGAFRIEIEVGGPSVRVTGGGIPGVVYGVEALIAHGGSDPSQIEVAPREESPGMLYRTFWTWDHSTNWELSQVGLQEIGVFNPYGKPPGGFLADYKRLVDFCSRNRIAAITIYGFLRDPHGGIEAAQELCRYAKERGVRIMPGIAIGAYGGVYWEGDHKYNLATWLKENPQFAATMEKGVGFQLADLSFPLNFPRSDYTVSACPSAPETMEWMEEAVGWLAETFEIGGINIESGDYGVCGCDRCVARRANAAEAARRKDDHGDSWSHTDMAENFPRLYRAAKAKKPDLWLYCEMQWDNLLDPVAGHAQTRLPKGGIYQHTANRSFWRRLRTELKRDYVELLPTQPNVLRCQFACQWNGDERTERYAFNARTFADMADDRRARRHGGADRVGRAVRLPRHGRALLPRLRPLHLGADTHLGAVHGRGDGATAWRAGGGGALRRHRRRDRCQPAAAGRPPRHASRRGDVACRRRRQPFRPALVQPRRPDRPARAHGGMSGDSIASFTHTGRSSMIAANHNPGGTSPTC